MAALRGDWVHDDTIKALLLTKLAFPKPYGYRTDNKKPPVKKRFLNLSVILDLSPGVFILSNSSRC